MPPAGSRARYGWAALRSIVLAFYGFHYRISFASIPNQTNIRKLNSNSSRNLKCGSVGAVGGSRPLEDSLLATPSGSFPKPLMWCTGNVVLHWTRPPKNCHSFTSLVDSLPGCLYGYWYGRAVLGYSRGRATSLRSPWQFSALKSPMTCIPFRAD